MSQGWMIFLISSIKCFLKINNCVAFMQMFLSLLFSFKSFKLNMEKQLSQKMLIPFSIHFAFRPTFTDVFIEKLLLPSWYISRVFNTVGLQPMSLVGSVLAASDSGKTESGNNILICRSRSLGRGSGSDEKFVGDLRAEAPSLRHQPAAGEVTPTHTDTYGRMLCKNTKL